MSKAQLVNITSPEVRALMSALKRNGLLLVFPPATMATLPPRNQVFETLLAVGQLMVHKEVSQEPVDHTVIGSQVMGVVFRGDMDLRRLDVCVTTFLQLETVVLDYAVNCKPSRWDESVDPVSEDESHSSCASSDSVDLNHGCYPIIMDPLKFLVWNVRGAASSNFRRMFAELKNQYHPNLVFLSETRIGGSRVDEIIGSLGFSNHFRVDSMGFPGGMWLLWENDQIEVHVHENNFQEIHTTVESVLIEKEVNDKRWIPPQVGRIKISHLLFADDVILFAKVGKKSIESIKKTLDVFFACSGLNVNREKSSVWFSPNHYGSIIGKSLLQGSAVVNCGRCLIPNFEIIMVIGERGFSKFLGIGNIVLAELWAIYLGIRLDEEESCLPLHVEFDSQTAVNLIKIFDTPSSHPCFPLIHAYRLLVARLHHISLSHIFREANSYANSLAKKAIELKLDYCTFNLPPSFVVLPLEAYLLGIEIPRRIGIG
ncbi:reverse transcriptase [Senna tora]|uniref:Reverse transcriptase n=1 Tax=Senna tora TaxID=362788 RepID=A0A834WTB5_9FABA|nr:reverse transcriptase [Senna tora]